MKTKIAFCTKLDLLESNLTPLVDPSEKKIRSNKLAIEKAVKSRLRKYHKLLRAPEISPAHWRTFSTSTESTLHQLSPYIGKLKSSIASDLIRRYTRLGELVADIYCGSGTIPLEAARLGRRVYAADASPYAIVLTKGKLYAPNSKAEAMVMAECALKRAATRSPPDLRKVPSWVRKFFHSQTLKEAISFAAALKNSRNNFLLACFLGILHHQRPGFLSYPSSHLVPYLRDKKFPKELYPKLYEYRPLRPRLLAKVSRAFKRAPEESLDDRVEFSGRASVNRLRLPGNLDCLITSPPYMNALDYGRDNRLRLWFLNQVEPGEVDRISGGFVGFQKSITALARELEKKLKPGGYSIFVIGEKDTRKTLGFPSAELTRLLAIYSPSLELKKIIADEIPDVRRSRRWKSAVKKEHILVFRKRLNA